MFVEYAYWHYVQSPAWLLRFFTTLQQALLQFFSVPLMLKTLFAPWRKDQARYGGGSVQTLLITFAWNLISRGIGFFVRTILLFLWLVCEALFLALAGLFLAAFLLWPLFIVASFALGLGLLLHQV